MADQRPGHWRGGHPDNQTCDNCSSGEQLRLKLEAAGPGRRIGRPGGPGGSRLGAVADPVLPVQPLQVRAHSVGRHAKLACDLLVAKTGGDKIHDFGLARS